MRKKAADHLDESTAALRADAKRLSSLVNGAPLDLKAVRAVYDSLGHFQAGVDKMAGVLKPQRLDTMRDGFRGLETSLLAGSDQVERLAAYSFPMVTFSGLRPEIHQRPFWPEGEKVAEGMRKAAAGATAAGKEMDEMVAQLPRVRLVAGGERQSGRQGSRGAAAGTGTAGKVEPLLKKSPRTPLAWPKSYRNWGATFRASCVTRNV